MATRVVEWKKPYTWGKAISIDENKVISLNLRDENNLIIYDAGDDEIYVDLQLDDEITPTSAFPIWVNVGRVIVDNWWDKPWTIISAETTSGDNIKIFYADEWTLWIDNWTWTFKQIYFKADVDALLLALRNYIDWELAKKQNWVSSDTAPSNPNEWDLWYDTTNSTMKVWNWTVRQSVGTWWWAEIEYVTQAEYNALPSSKLTDWKHYVIYTPDSPTPPSPRQPWVDTVLYYDFEHTSWTAELNQASNSNYNGTYTATPTISTLASWKKYFNWSNAVGLYTNNRVTTIDYDNATLNVRVKIDGQDGNIFGQARWNTWDNPTIFWNIYQNDMQVCLGKSSNAMNNITPPSWWVNIVVCNDSSSSNLYINGSLAQSTPYVSATKTEDYYLYINVVETADKTPPPRSNLIWSFSFGSVIIENKTWTAQEIQDYYDQTKWDYWIS